MTARPPLGLLAVAAATGSIVLLGWAWWYAGRGLDVTDEGYALAWIAAPGAYDVSATQFGYLWHPAWELADGSIATLRRANLLLTFALGTLASWLALAAPLELQLARARRLVLAVGLGAAALVAHAWLAPTPDYNSLALHGLLVATAGLLLARDPRTRARTIGAATLGVGGWLAFMGKPTTAAALALLALAWLGASRRTGLREAAVAIVVATVLVGASALAIDGSIGDFVERLRTEQRLQRVLDNGHTLREALRLDGLDWGWVGWASFGGLALVVAGAIRLATARTGWAGVVLATGALGAVALTVLAGRVDLMPDEAFGVQRVALLLAVAVGVVAGTALVVGPRELPSRLAGRRALLALALASLPWALAFGTNNDYWFTGSAAAIAWVLAALVLVAPALEPGARLATVTVAALATQVVAALLVSHAWHEPYRQQGPLSAAATTPTELGPRGATLRLPAELHESIEHARLDARDAGLEPRTPVIDLSGRSPGWAHALGAVPAGRPWLPGGYPGSDGYAAAMLSRTPCEELARAWIIDEPDGPRRLSPEVLAEAGLPAADLDARYSRVAAFDGRELLRPRSAAGSEAAAECARARGTRDR